LRAGAQRLADSVGRRSIDAKRNESPEFVEAGKGQPALRDVKDGRATRTHQILSDLLLDGFMAVAREYAFGAIRIGPFRQSRGA
jgi:hypothetical protein